MRYMIIITILVLSLPSCGWPQSGITAKRAEAEYYVAAYANHYHVPLPLVRAIVERESDWRQCAASPKGAVGLMQLMPATAQRLRVRDRCDIEQNISGGVRYVAWLTRLFHGDYRLVAGAYYAGENIVERRGLAYQNPDVLRYVAGIRSAYLRQVDSLRPVLERRD
jgi:soluble lytic murein transglycosylase-like protein